MDIVNEKIGIKDILSGLADLVFIKDTFSKKEKKETKKEIVRFDLKKYEDIYFKKVSTYNKKEFEEKLNEVYKAQEEIGATKRIESYEQDIEKHVEPKTRGRKTLVKEIKPKQDAIQTQQLENNKEIKTGTDEKEQTL